MLEFLQKAKIPGQVEHDIDLLFEPDSWLMRPQASIKVLSAKNMRVALTCNVIHQKIRTDYVLEQHL